MGCQPFTRENFSKYTLFLFLLVITVAFILMSSYIAKRDNKALAANPTLLEHVRSGIMQQISGDDLYEDSLPDLDLLSEIIMDELDGPPRTPPPEQDIRNMLPKVYSALPAQFLPNTRSPCWYEEFDPLLGNDIYEGNVYAQAMKGVNNKLGKLALNHQEHLHQMDGKLYRLRCLPYIYIIGQPKSGTTDLFYRMTQHPQIGGTITKEPHWWTWRGFGHGFMSSDGKLFPNIPFQHYLDLFDDAARQIQTKITSDPPGDQILVVDGSTSIMWNNQVWSYFSNSSTDKEPKFLTMDFLHAAFPGARLLAILRDPGERVYSEYLYCTTGNKSSTQFHSMVVQSVQLFYNCLSQKSFRWCVHETDFGFTMPAKLNVGMYAVYLKDWFDVFPSEHIMVLRFEDYSTNLASELNRLYRFLDIAPLPKEQEEEILNKPVYNPRHEEDVPLGGMLPETKTLLQQFYEPFNIKLANLLEDDGFLWNYE